MSNEKQKVFVGMSGGVDSSVSACLLKEQGYDVTGVFIKVWQPDFMTCTWKEDRRDAMRVAAHLDIPFVTLDLEKEYKEEVVDYMIDEYKRGRTPNPDVMCNRYVKFGGFFDWAMKQGADYIATGHYAQTRVEGDPLHSAEARLLHGDQKRVVLLKGKDDNKDQSYFLWTLTSEQLSKTLFPVGNIEKPEVRKLAKKFKLPNAEKKDSQGLCFIGTIDMKEFLKHFIEEQRGDVLNELGEVIGYHDGSLFYTLGERHGFTITKKTPDDAPYFVIAKDIEKNTLTVSHKGVEGVPVHEKGRAKIILIKETNWTLPISDTIVYSVRIRYRGELHKTHIVLTSKETAEIHFTEEGEAVAPGQSVVVYDDEVCVGGGVVA